MAIHTVNDNFTKLWPDYGTLKKCVVCHLRLRIALIKFLDLLKVIYPSPPAGIPPNYIL